MGNSRGAHCAGHIRRRLPHGGQLQADGHRRNRRLYRCGRLSDVPPPRLACRDIRARRRRVLAHRSILFA